MRFRDAGYFFAVLLVILLTDLALAVAGVRDPKPSDYDRASIIAAFAVVLLAIREKQGAEQ